MSAAAAMISLHAVSKRFAGRDAEDDVTAVDDLSLTVEEGETLVLLGASGCGKTTTLKMINRLEEATSGRIEVAGRDVATQDAVSLRRSIGYVFQGIGLFPHWDVASNVGAIPHLLGWSRQRIDERVDELLELVGLPADDYRRRRPAELSGGQRQRVGVARALAAEAKVLLMDEPFGAVDPLTRDTLQQQLRSMREALGLTVVLVTHDVAEALLLADRLAILDRGRLVQLGTPAELFARPASEVVSSLLEMPRRQAERLYALARSGSPPGDSAGDATPPESAR